MTFNDLRKQFPNEQACRRFFESVIWLSGRVKQCIAAAVEREGAVRAALVDHGGEYALRPFVEAAVDPATYLAHAALGR